MSNIMKRSFNSPDKIVEPGEKQRIEVVALGKAKIQKVTAEPGWQWSKHIKPVIKTENCQKHHQIYVISGKLGSRMTNGDEKQFNPGDIGDIPPGHDGWTVGDDPAVWLEIVD